MKVSPQRLAALVEKFTPMVWRLAHMQMAAGIGERLGTVDDLAQEGFAGLIHAIDKFQPRRRSPRTGRPVKLFTYVYTSVRRYIFCACTRLGAGVIRISTTASKRLLSCPDLGVDRIAAAAVRALKPFSLEALGSDGTDRLNALAVVPVDHAAEADEARFLGVALEKLPERLRFIVRARFYSGLRLREVAAELGVTRERARQLEGRALKLLREIMGGGRCS